MKLIDTMNGPVWGLWVVFAVFLILSIVLLTGHGANLIAGYNTASKQEKARYDEKKLCRVTGAGLALITLLILIMLLGLYVLPAWFAHVVTGITVVDVIVLLVLSNTICKK